MRLVDSHLGVGGSLLSLVTTGTPCCCDLRYSGASRFWCRGGSGLWEVLVSGRFCSLRDSGLWEVLVLRDSWCLRGLWGIGLQVSTVSLGLTSLATVRCRRGKEEEGGF